MAMNRGIDGEMDPQRQLVHLLQTVHLRRRVHPVRIAHLPQHGLQLQIDNPHQRQTERHQTIPHRARARMEEEVVPWVVVVEAVSGAAVAGGDANELPFLAKRNPPKIS
jgi:hypothetical protein